MHERPVPRLVAATDDERLSRPDYRERLEALLAAGCPAILVRAKRLGGRDLYKYVCYTRERCAARGAELWVGDRADIARAAEADGLQLPERGLSMAGARRAIGPPSCDGPRPRIGRSVHSFDGALAAAGEGADHIVVGAIYATVSHPGVEPARPELLARIRAALDARGLPIPILAIGGLTPERAAEVGAAGAAGVVAVRALWDAEDPTRAVHAFLER
ncbi:MAG TPA: thiamine phosphate synthase [Gemmatimonadota bacterium]|nr:thiamine phosphate synthase [Gemmatimonadota bacterium]